MLASFPFASIHRDRKHYNNQTSVSCFPTGNLLLETTWVSYFPWGFKGFPLKRFFCTFISTNSNESFITLSCFSFLLQQTALPSPRRLKNSTENFWLVETCFLRKKKMFIFIKFFFLFLISD